MKRRKLKKKPIVVLLCTSILAIVLTIFIIKTVNELKYRDTLEFKLITQGYSKDKIELLEEKTNEDFMNSLLDREYDEMYLNIINEKYYIKSNLEKYIDYYENHLNSNSYDVVAIINVGADKEHYTNIKDTNTSYEKLMINNKYYKLPSDYEPNDLVDVSNWYSYGNGQKLRQEAYDAFVTMYNIALREDIKLIVNSSYRPYKEQEEIYNDYLSKYTQEHTDSYAARPGHSEHQTGLALDIITPGANGENFDSTEAFKWLENNAYKYGFILRYPKDKEYLTGYNYESWHFRYVGTEVATKIHDENITLDEYYAYYIENVSNS